MIIKSTIGVQMACELVLSYVQSLDFPCQCFCRFAGLLLVTKCIPPDDIGARLEVFHAVGSSFLVRLLLPLRKGRIYPKPLVDDGEVEKQVHLAGLGLSVLVSLCASKDVASCDEVVIVCEVALGVLKYGPSRLVAWYLQLEESQVMIPPDVEIAMLTNCCDCISLIGPEHEGVVGVECFDVFANRLELLYESMLDVQDGDGQRKLYESLCRCITVCLHPLDRQETRTEVLIPILSKWFAIMSSKGNNGRIQNRDACLQYHLEALQCLVHIFETHNSTLWGDPSGWIRPIVYGLESVFASRVPDTVRYHALKITLHLITIGGTSWLYSSKSDVTFELLVQTLRVEIGVLILDAMSPNSVIDRLETLNVSTHDATVVPSGQDQAVHVSLPKSADIVERSADHVVVTDNDEEGAILAGDRALQNLPLCLIIFEHMVEALSSIVSKDEFVLADDVVQRIFDALTEIAELELQFLEQTIGGSSSIQDGMSPLLGIIWGTFCTFASQNPYQFSERIIQILPDVLRHMSLSETRHVVPVLYGIIVSEYSMSSHMESLVQPDIFIPLSQVLKAIEVRQSGIVFCGEEGNMMVIMLQEILLKLLRVSLSASSMPLSASQICESLPELRDVEHILLSTFPVSRDGAREEFDTELCATCLGMAARIYLLSEKQETILQGLLETYIQRIIQKTILADDTNALDSPAYREVFLVLKELCSKEASKFGSLPIGPSHTPLTEIIYMLDC